MEVTDYIGPLSLVPAAVAVILAFTTRNTVFSLAVACLVGVLVSEAKGAASEAKGVVSEVYGVTGSLRSQLASHN